ncbi:MAG: hypothetical protein ACLQVD_21320, partial [Capsulimonadaceae bacterium]
MNLWSVQKVSTWRSLEAAGELRVAGSWTATEWPDSMLWLIGQLRMRIPGYAGGFPWWAWCS